MKDLAHPQNGRKSKETPRRYPIYSPEVMSEIILLGRQYGYVRNTYLARLAIALLVIVTALVIGIFIIWEKPARYRYILTTEKGVVMELPPLDAPNHTNEYVVKWTIDAITNLHSYDFVNYRQQMAVSRKKLTPNGWSSFEEALKPSGQFNTIFQLGFVAMAAPNGPGQVVATGNYRGRYAWKVKFPIILTYQSPRDDGPPKIITQKRVATVTVIRMPEYLHDSGLAVIGHVIQ
ncbi:DotI/IcmL/TraM family protein [Flexibacterium corallicola]|uniref:DotI/IcmL/TraM family protein n=1 Tax=Flexibacterium corallicola TaxID=3037259 RepID=UPI00286EEA0E|nr:DotI/IcmL/TraM family protein [Pseudovibrio sp. M1P-2-3]